MVALFRQSVTQAIGDRRSQDRQGQGRKVRRHLKRNAERLAEKIAAESDPQRKAGMQQALQKKLALLAKMERNKGPDLFIDPRAAERQRIGNHSANYRGPRR